MNVCKWSCAWCFLKISFESKKLLFPNLLFEAELQRTQKPPAATISIFWYYWWRVGFPRPAWWNAFNQAMIIAQNYSNVKLLQVQTFLCSWNTYSLHGRHLSLEELVETAVLAGSQELFISVLSLWLSQKIISSETMVFSAFLLLS